MQFKLIVRLNMGFYYIIAHKCGAATVIWHLLALCHLEDNMTEVLENIINTGKSVLYINNLEHAIYFFTHKSRHILNRLELKNFSPCSLCFLPTDQCFYPISSPKS
jgi:hypothetical protein